MKQNFKAKGKNAPQKPAKGSSLKPSRTVRIPDDKKLKVIGHQLKPCVILTESSLNLKEEELLMGEDEMLELEAETLETAAEDEAVQCVFLTIKNLKSLATNLSHALF